jgi:DNA-binding transcriptional ArsR family regulator
LSVDQRVLGFLKNNPGASPREIADALGLPISTVRIAILRLREAGYVVKSARGGYVVRVAPPPIEDYLTGESGVGDKLADLKNITQKLEKRIENLENIIERLVNRIDKLETELRLLSKGVGSQQKGKGGSMRSRPADRLLAGLKEKGILSFEEAKSLTVRPISYYVDKGQAMVVGDYIVDPDFFKEFKKRFPLILKEVGNLSKEEKRLLDEMIKDGQVYLYGGKEYRLIE